MKFAALITVLLPSAINGFTFTPAKTGRAFNTALDGSIVYYSTSTGNTETVAEYIAKAVGCEMEEIGLAKEDEFKGVDSLIVGAPTWHTGADEQRSGTSWDEFLYDTLPNIDMDGKKVAVFGVGDQQVRTFDFLTRLNVIGHRTLPSIFFYEVTRN
jgi:flavodoxin I